MRINWQDRVVEVDAEVVLREGPLELFACSPQTREHESILVVKAKPLSIMQAMGLIGLEPGNPVQFDEKSRGWNPASGESLDLRVRCEGAETPEPVLAGAWLIDTKTQKPPDRLDWIFAGSRTVREGRFGADVDGTVACVVDFETALIALQTPHSADNEELWLAANTAAIPPRRTACTILIRSAHRITLEVVVDDNGLLQLEGQRITPDELAEKLRPTSRDPRFSRIRMLPSPKASHETVIGAENNLKKAGFQGVIEIRSTDRPKDAQTPPKSPSGNRD